MTSPSPAPLALSGVRVVELGSLIAGPFATRMLGDFGAEVIKVESPTRPDPMRDWGRVRTGGRSLWWAIQSRNKHSIALDLKDEADFTALRGLLDEADVLVENFRPGTLERLGLAPETLWASNPGLVIARVSGYGQTGASAQKPGYAAVAEAASGLRYLNGYPDQAPPRTGISLGDSLASLYAVQGIMMALYWRDGAGAGRGQVVDVSLVESCFSLLEGAVAEYAHSGVIPGPSGSRLKGIAPSNIYRSADGKWVVIAANQDTVYSRLTEAIGIPELANDPRFSSHVARGEHQDELDGIISTWASALTSEAIMRQLDAHGVPTSTVNTIEDIFTDPLFRERDMLVDVVENGERIVHPGVVPRLSATPGRIAWSGKAEQELLADVIGSDTEGEHDMKCASESGVEA